MPALRSPFLFLGLLTSCPSQGLGLVCLNRNRTRQGTACSVGKEVSQLQAVPARLALLTSVPSVVGEPPGCIFSSAECILCGHLLAFWLPFAFLSPLTGGQETERVVASDSPWVIA